MSHTPTEHRSVGSSTTASTGLSLPRQGRGLRHPLSHHRRITTEGPTDTARGPAARTDPRELRRGWGCAGTGPFRRSKAEHSLPGGRCRPPPAAAPRVPALGTFPAAALHPPAAGPGPGSGSGGGGSRAGQGRGAARCSRGRLALPTMALRDGRGRAGRDLPAAPSAPNAPGNSPSSLARAELRERPKAARPRCSPCGGMVTAVPMGSLRIIALWLIAAGPRWFL